MFILNMIWAVIILGRAPSKPEYLGGAIILLSVISSLIEKARYAKMVEEEEAQATHVKQGSLGSVDDAMGVEMPSGALASSPAAALEEGGKGRGKDVTTREGEEVIESWAKVKEWVIQKGHSHLQDKYV